MTAVGHAAIIVAERKALLARTESLVREFHPALPAGTVIHAVTRCRAQLLRAGVRRGLAGITERIRALHGWADLESEPGIGTRLRVSLPRD